MKRDSKHLSHSSPVITSEQILKLRKNILRWYDGHHRELPWRRSRPGEARDSSALQSHELSRQQYMYWVWVGEVMSQQTQVQRAGAYFERFITCWPTIQDLSRATMTDIEEVWAGLGYYRRARYLSEGAKFVVDDLHGIFPTTSAGLQVIPGVGPYTAAAMASIAADEVVAVVDANVIRVLARLRCLDWDPKKVKQWSTFANKLVDPERPGDFNQECDGPSRSLMTSPEEKEVANFPNKAPPAKRREDFVAVCVVCTRPCTSHEGLYLLVQRSRSGLLPGLWEFPQQFVDPKSCHDANRKTLDSYLLDTLGVSVTKQNIVSRQYLGEVVHSFSHIRRTLSVEQLVLKDFFDSGNPAQAPLGRPTMQWVPHSRVRKVFNCGSIKRVWTFFENASW